MIELIPWRDPRWFFIAGAGLLAFLLPVLSQLRQFGPEALRGASTFVTSHVVFLACVLLGYRFTGPRGAMALLALWGLLTLALVLVIGHRPARGRRTRSSRPTGADIELAHRMIQLRRGWNLISVPLRPLNERCDKLLGSELRCWAWDAERQMYFRPANVSAGYALWIHCEGDRAITLYGYPVDVSSRRLHAGWNLVGPTEQRPAPRNPTLRGAIFGFEAGRTVAAEELVPGRGYWVWADQAVDVFL